MKTSEILAIFLLNFAQFSSGILNKYEYDSNLDITTIREFGCRWKGGTTSSLSCHCHDDSKEMHIQEKSIPAFDTMGIEVVGCRQVRFAGGALNDMTNLRKIRISNVNSLTFEENSLVWYGYKSEDQSPYEERFDISVPSLKITIDNSYVTSIGSRSFTGRISEVTMENVTIVEVAPFAFSNLRQTEKIVLKNAVLLNVRPQAFKQFGTENLQLLNVTADLLPSRTFSNIRVYEGFTIAHCYFNTLRPGTFTITHPQTFEVTYTNVTNLNGEAFKVSTLGSVWFKNNKFDNVNDGAFQGIHLLPEATTKSLTFDTNTFTTLSRDSLRVNADFNTKFLKLNINQQCDCNTIVNKINVHKDFLSEIRCVYEGDYVTIDEYKSHMCSLLVGYSTTIIIVVVVLVLLFIIIVVLVLYYKRVHRSKKYGKQAGKNGNLSLIVPDGRTYRETELHVIVERTDLLTTDL